MEVLWFNLAWQLSTTKNGWWEENVMTETSYTALVSGTLYSAMYVPAQCFLSTVERSWQSPPSTPVPWDPLRAVSGKFFESGGVKLLPVSQRSHKHSPAFLQRSSRQLCSWLGWWNLAFLLIKRRKPVK